MFFDSDRDGNWDPGLEPRQPTSTFADGTMHISLPLFSVPVVPGGDYPVRADFPEGGPIEASATFTVIPSGPHLWLNHGPVGTFTAVFGDGFAAGENLGRVFFDSNKNGAPDVGEPITNDVTTSLDGSFSALLTVPSVAPGDYPVRVDFPSGGSIEQSFTFTVTQPLILVNPSAGPAGTQAWITGSGFIPLSNGSVYFDLNDTGHWDAGEPGQDVTTDTIGNFTAGPVTVPDFPPGYYSVRTNIPGDGGPIPVNASFLLW